MSNPLCDVPDNVLGHLRNKTGQTKIVVVGATNNPQKYGNIIVKNLKQKGYSVVPVNPKEKIIEGEKCYPHVAAVPGPTHIVNFVVPPKVAKSVLTEMHEKGIIPDVVWFQDGSFDDETIRLAKKHFPIVVYNACIMVVTNYV